MRYISIILLVLLSCHRHLQSSINSEQIKYRVYKIDSLGPCYLIYAKQLSSVFKIISPKQNNNTCASIKINKYYNFNINPILFNNPVLNTHGLAYSQEIQGYYHNDSTLILLEKDSINELYTCKNFIWTLLYGELDILYSINFKKLILYTLSVLYFNYCIT